MAFRATQRVQPVRQISYQAAPEETQSSASQQRKRTLEDSQEEWILFSPTAPSVTQTETTSTDRTPRTTGVSLLSDFGSLDTGAARSDNLLAVDDISDNATEHASDQDEDLDSLDDGLHAFHEPSDLSSPVARLMRESVLPAHDGLGSFGESSAIQDHLRQFERYAPKRKQKLRSNVQQTLDALLEVEEQDTEADRIRRIEQWRLEQSRALLEEIEKETRRMRKISRARSRASSLNMQTKSETNLSESEYTEEYKASRQVAIIPKDGPPENESFWQRFTRRVIRDLIGIDEELLSVILGESLPEEAQNDSSSTSSLPPLDIQQEIAQVDEEVDAPLTWQERLLERLARELGILVHQLSEHPGAFSTYMQTQEPAPYAGLPNTATLPDTTTDSPALPPVTRSTSLFPPTAHQQVAENADPSLWGIEEEAAEDEPAITSLPNITRLRREQEYWEKELDVRMVFNFLKSRFSSDLKSSQELDNITTDLPFGGVQASPSTAAAQSNRRASNTSAYTAHRAAIIRQHHPLASATTRRQRERSLQPRHHSGIARRTTRTASSSCASQSTKKSKRSSNSRNYWDVGGSVGSGGNGGIGAWGEVSV